MVCPRSAAICSLSVHSLWERHHPAAQHSSHHAGEHSWEIGVIKVNLHLFLKLRTLTEPETSLWLGYTLLYSKCSTSIADVIKGNNISSRMGNMSAKQMDSNKQQQKAHRNIDSWLSILCPFQMVPFQHSNCCDNHLLPFLYSWLLKIHFVWFSEQGEMRREAERPILFGDLGFEH